MMDFEHLSNSVKDINMPNDMKKRIIDNTLQQTEETIFESTSESRHGVVPRKSAAVLLIATLVLSMSAVAFAVSTSDWFAAFFIQRSGSTLTPDQYQFIAEKSVGIGQSITSDGYTVTVDSAICDAHNLYLVIQIEGPVGCKLDLGDEGNLYFAHTKFESTGRYESTGDIISSGMGCVDIDDEDEKENTAVLLIHCHRVLTVGSNQVYTDGEIWRFHFADLCTQTGELHDVQTLLAEGGWSFEFRLSEMSEEVELIDTPVVCVVQSGGEGMSRENVEIMVTSLVLSPFGATCNYSFLPGSKPKSVDILDIYLVMKDGCIVTLSPGSGGGAGAYDSESGTMSYVFSVPIILDDAAYLVLPDNVQVPFPER